MPTTDQHLFAWTDGSFFTTQNQENIANSSVYFSQNSPYNITFRTTGQQSVFNAEAEAAECALFSLPFTNITLVIDSKSLAETLIKLRTVAKTQRQKLKMNSNPTVELQNFVKLIMFKYSKTHKYAEVLQSILLQILIREHQGYSVHILHVNSHLLDTYMGKPPKLTEQVIKKRFEKMKQKYGEQTMFLLQGNFFADQQLERPIMQTLYQQVNLKASTLPQFILKDSSDNSIFCNAIKHVIKKNSTTH